MIIKMSPLIPYARRQASTLLKVRNDSKSEDNTLKNGIRAPTLRYSGEVRLWKATEACGWENISSVTGRLMSQLLF